MSVSMEQSPSNKHGFIANSASSVGVFYLARRLAKFNVPVLITGETGTGKECIAKYIHENAVGNDGPYVGVNCAAIPENMLEAVLFGYEKGAFTGAVNSVPGKFEMANGGTLLLDEIGDMPLALQAKLLRVLQEQEVERLGSHKRIPLNIRLVTATNKDLQTEIAEGNFRQDLFYRISVVPIHIMPLRERPQDIVPLAQCFIKKYQDLYQGDVMLSNDARRALLDYEWPGNVRELENVIQRGLIMSHGGEITADALGLTPSVPTMPTLSVTEMRAESQPAIPTASEGNGGADAIHQVKLHGRMAQYQYIVELLRQHKGSKSKTAEFLGITPRALRYRLASMREEGIDVECYS